MSGHDETPQFYVVGLLADADLSDPHIVYECSVCGVVVNEFARTRHADWHRYQAERPT